MELADERVIGGEPVADLVVKSGHLKGTEIGGDLIPRLIDELPVLAVAACFAEGTTVIRDAEELRVKESDRIDTTVTELARLGAKIEARQDGMVIQGTGRLTGGACQSHGDHRLAMSLAVAGALAQRETIIHGAEVASVSYPDFWQHMSVGGSVASSITGEPRATLDVDMAIAMTEQQVEPFLAALGDEFYILCCAQSGRKRAPT